MEPAINDAIQGIFWLKLDDGRYLNLGAISSSEVAKQDHANKLTLKYATQDLEFAGDNADAIQGRLNLLSDRNFTEAFYRIVLKLAVRGNPKKRGCKQKPATKEKLAMLSRGLSVTVIAEFYGEKELPKLKSVYLSEGYTGTTAEILAQKDLIVWLDEEKARLRALRSDYDLGTFQRKRRKKKRQMPTKGTQI